MMEKKIDTTFKADDEILKGLVLERRKEVAALQKKQAAEIHGEAEQTRKRMSALHAVLNKNTADQLERLSKFESEEEKNARTTLQDLRKKLVSEPKHAETALVPDMQNAKPEGGPLGLIGWKIPYYGVLHGSDGAVYWQGYNPGNIDLWLQVSGEAGGVAHGSSVYMDWWLAYTTETARFYQNYIYVPYHGFVIARADDGLWDSRKVMARIDLSAQGYQGHWKPFASINVYNLDSQNINLNERIDGWRAMAYWDLLSVANTTAYLRVTSTYTVYARGGGAYAELNFAMGAPRVYIV